VFDDFGLSFGVCGRIICDFCSEVGEWCIGGGESGTHLVRYLRAGGFGSVNSGSVGSVFIAPVVCCDARPWIPILKDFRNAISKGSDFRGAVGGGVGVSGVLVSRGGQGFVPKYRGVEFAKGIDLLYGVLFFPGFENFVCLFGSAFECNFGVEGVWGGGSFIPKVEENAFEGGGTGHPGREFIGVMFIVFSCGMETECEGDVSADVLVCDGVGCIVDGVEDGVRCVCDDGVRCVKCSVGFVVGNIEAVYTGGTEVVFEGVVSVLILCYLPKIMFVQKFQPRFLGTFFEFMVVRKIGGVVAFFNKVKVPPHNEMYVVRDS